LYCIYVGVYPHDFLYIILNIFVFNIII
jgi:hypothetical protein